ncbi:MAG: phosphomethylpyrimidine kinase [Gammaproteobacteria bacterium]|nr:phosphomethylpyrimidine kinase [Gammaproteobacteria bacterium]MYK47723.1 phosphomethylpyrimidine kinase [Gammaproteobacteria bacterium]
MSETAWTIAGSDSGGGAGVQADLLTFHDFGLHGASVVTCVTAQNTTALTDNHVIPAATVRAQLEALWDDLAPAAIKIGALGSPDNASAVLEFLSALPNDGRPFVVWDPVRYASVGGALGVLSDDTIDAFLRHVDVVTPNAEELADTWNIDPHSPAQAARLLRNRGAERVYLTGGHGNTPGVDHWESAECSFAIRGDALPGRGAHGGGCSLSSALAAATVREDEESAPVLAHMYVHQGLRAIASRVGNPGAGRPPLPHLGWPGDAEDLPRVVDAGRDIGATFPPLSHPIGLYAVVGSVDWVRRCVELRVDTVQLRVKDLPAPALRHAVAESVAATGGSSTRLFVNDFWREAIDAGAYGVHLGQEDLTDADLPAIAAAGLRLGVSTHSYYEIARAHAIAPSYVAIGPIFATTTKPMKFAPQGIARLRRWVNLLKPRYPLTAIGGIDVERVSGVMASGVGSIAVVRAITEAADPAVAVADLRAAMHSDHADVR